MVLEFKTDDWEAYKMDMRNPHETLEPIENEIAVVSRALNALKDAGILPHTDYDHEKFTAHRNAIRENFEIPWTGITPRMQRLLYAVNAITQPRNMLAAGIFCGNTFISNAGAAMGPGAVYEAEQLIGIEINPDEAARAARNLQRIDPIGKAEIVAADAVEYVGQWTAPIDLLYLDADGAGGRGKGVYLDILEAGYSKIPEGAIVLAHNSVNAYERLRHYLEFVRDPANMRVSVNIIFDGEGLEVSMK